MKGYTPEELIPPCDIPLFMVSIWNDFTQLNQSRTAGMGANPISYTEIDAYARLMNIKFSKFEVLIIKRLDSLFMNSQG